MAEEVSTLALNEDCQLFPTSVQISSSKGKHVVAARGLEAGAIALKSRPYGAVIVDGSEKARCHLCFDICGETSILCQGCHSISYCRRACLEADIPVHSNAVTAGGECLALSRLGEVGMADGESTMTLRLLIRIAARKAMENAQSAHSGRVCRKDTSLYAGSRHPSDAFEMSCACRQYSEVQVLVTHEEKAASDVKVVVQQIAARLAHIMPPGANLKRRDVASLLFAAQCNAHAITDTKRKVLGLGLYPLASMVNHGCAPTCHHSFSFSMAGENEGAAPMLVFRATRAVPAGSELVYSYVDLYQSTPSRQRLLRTAYYFTCSCERCLGVTALASRLLRGDRKAQFDENPSAAEKTYEADIAIDGMRCGGRTECCGTLAKSTGWKCTRCPYRDASSICVANMLDTASTAMEQAGHLAATALERAENLATYDKKRAPLLDMARNAIKRAFSPEGPGKCLHRFHRRRLETNQIAVRLYTASVAHAKRECRTDVRGEMAVFLRQKCVHLVDAIASIEAVCGNTASPELASFYLDLSNTLMQVRDNHDACNVSKVEGEEDLATRDISRKLKDLLFVESGEDGRQFTLVECDEKGYGSLAETLSNHAEDLRKKCFGV